MLFPWKTVQYIYPRTSTNRNSSHKYCNNNFTMRWTSNISRQVITTERSEQITKFISKTNGHHKYILIIMLRNLSCEQNQFINQSLFSSAIKWHIMRKETESSQSGHFNDFRTYKNAKAVWIDTTKIYCSRAEEPL